MGRHSHDHCYIQWIILLDDSGNTSQRYQLDENGKLINKATPIHQKPRIPILQTPNNSQPPYFEQNTSHQVPYPLPKFDVGFPITPMMRQKFLSTLDIPRRSSEFPSPPPSEQDDLDFGLNIIDIRPFRAIQV